ncbi:helix-turn-helix domain-containing protein [Streptomyces californicus]|uniref:helix-turn-helix domain-containing protein n=1 Tax=Streptomyces californicus TaxID=67351 RepID=UPI00296EF0B7|nr:helix-turn-helix domain-containing protein [Streptomyces californicus]MDW4918752.1 helix-turn-helix domain-containing protein [Streptomyces californicus]
MPVSPRDQSESTTCRGPGCFNPLKQSPRGRRRYYCSDPCGTRYRRSVRPAADNGAFAEASLAELNRLTGQFDLSGDSPERNLALIVECEKVWKDLKSAVVLQSRDSRMKMPEIAQRLHMSTTTLARSLDSAPGRRERRLAPELDIRVPEQPRPQRHPAPGPPRARRPKGGTGDLDGAAPGSGPAATLASALSHLHRRSGTTYRTLSSEVGVDPSYISRAISGERIPSWPVTQKLALALAAAPEEILPLWRSARGYDTAADAADLQAALRGLRTAAASPDIGILAERTRLTRQQITDALNGRMLPDWTTTAAIVTALNGQPDLLRPLWNSARAATLAHGTGSTCTISAGAFG